MHCLSQAFVPALPLFTTRTRFGRSSDASRVMGTSCWVPRKSVKVAVTILLVPLVPNFTLPLVMVRSVLVNLASMICSSCPLT